MSDRRRLFDPFGRIARFYDWLMKPFLDGFLLNMISPEKADILLDAGGGTGRVATVLIDRVRMAIVADISLGMLRRASGKGLSSVCSPAEHLAFPSGCFDRVLMVYALHHVNNQVQAVGELVRVLSPGGRLIMVEPDLHRFAVKIIAMGENLLLLHSHFLSSEEILALFMNLDIKVKVEFHKFNVVIIAEKKP